MSHQRYWLDIAKIAKVAELFITDHIPPLHLPGPTSRRLHWPQKRMEGKAENRPPSWIRLLEEINPSNNADWKNSSNKTIINGTKRTEHYTFSITIRKLDNTLAHITTKLRY
jgi:hypothetical protein